MTDKLNSTFNIPIVKIHITDVTRAKQYPVELKCEWFDPFTGDEMTFRLNKDDHLQITIPALTAWYAAKQRVNQATPEDIANALRQLI